jgi:hypothetical protein
MKKNFILLLFLTTTWASAQSRICSGKNTTYLTDIANWCWDKNGGPAAPDSEKSNWTGLTYAGDNLPFPFDQNSQIGVYTIDRCLPKDGWVLYDRRLNDYDRYDRALHKATSQSSGINNLPYFSLYNRRKGVLKTFIFKGQGSTIDHAGYLQINVGIFRQNLSFSGTQGITSIDSREISLPVKSPNTEQEVIKYVIETSEINKWIIFDTEIGYDPYLINSGTIAQLPINLRYSIFSVKESAFTLSGTLSTPDVKPSFFTALFKAGQDAVGAGGMGFAGFLAPTIGGNLLKKLKTDFLGKKREDGKTMDWDSALASGFKDAKDAKAWGNIPWVSAFTQLTASKTTFSKNQIDLKGTITETPLIMKFDLPLPGANLDEYPGTERPYFFYSNPGEELGLFSFERNPIMNIQAIYDNYSKVVACGSHSCTNQYYDRYFTFSLEDVTKILKINPNSPMNLKEVKIQILEKGGLGSGPLFNVYGDTKYTEWSSTNSFLGIQNYLLGSQRFVTMLPYIKFLLVFTPKGGGDDFVVAKTLNCDYQSQLSTSLVRIFPFTGKYMLNNSTVEGPGILNETSGISRQWKINGLARVFADYLTTSGAIETTVSGLTKVEFQSIGDLLPTIDGVRPSTLKNLGTTGSYTKWMFSVKGAQKKVAWTAAGTLRNIKITPIPFVATILESLLL